MLLLESNNLFRVQFFESFCEEGSILWVMLKKASILWVMLKKVLGSVGHIRKIQYPFFGSYQKKFNLVGHIFIKEVQFFESLRKNQFFESFGEKDVQFYESFWRTRSSILWVIFKKNSARHIREKRCSILCVKLKKRFNALSQFQIFESYSKNFNSLSHMKRFKKVEFSVIFVKTIFNNDSILWVTFNKRGTILWKTKNIQFIESLKWFNSSSHEKENSILWVILKKRFNVLSHIQVFESNWRNQSLVLWVVFKKKKNSLNHTYKVQSQWVTFSKRFNSWKSYLWKRAQVFQSYFKNQGSILLSHLKKGSIHWDTFKKRVQFFD